MTNTKTYLAFKSRFFSMGLLHQHFIEVKLRFLYIIFSTISTFLVCYNFQIEIIYILSKPFINLEQTFIFLRLTEAFYTLVKICTILTFFIITPLLFYHVWCFFLPSFYKFERISKNFFFFLFCFLFTIEILFTYFIILPKICDFLLGFEMSSELYDSNFILKPLISIEFSAQIGSYVEFLLTILTSLLTFFQIPICICFFYSKNLLRVRTFYSNRKFLILLALFTAAFLVPPDAISEIFVTFFIYLIFEFLILVGLLLEELKKVI